MNRTLKGALGGLAATGAMTLAMTGLQKLGVLGKPPPERIVERLLGRFRGHTRAGELRERALASVAHAGFGATMGTLFALASGKPTMPRGLAFGLLVWATSYVGMLPALRLMPPAHRDRPGRQASMVAAHLVYGASLAGALRALEGAPRLAGTDLS